MVYYFHQADDPYSAQMIGALKELSKNYDIALECYLVPAPDDDAAPERQLLIDWSRKDANFLNGRLGLNFDFQEQPSQELTDIAEEVIAAAISLDDNLDCLQEVSKAYWRQDEIALEKLGKEYGRASKEAVLAAKEKGQAKRQEARHYLGAVIHYGKENYWGLDRLHYLEERLTEMGLRKEGHEGYIAPPASESDYSGSSKVPQGTKLVWYPSFRSPYTAISAPRVFDLADRYGAEVEIKFVLPMVMRNLPVPKEKRGYIPRDTAREARRLGIPYGKMCDPVGRPTERIYSMLPTAIEMGKAREYLLAAYQMVWSEGLDAGTTGGLKKIAKRAGIDWAELSKKLDTDDWREIEDKNRAEMVANGLWGVPSFRVDEVAVWGQDRLWVIEEKLQSLL